jgi:hypothetical protein
LAVFRFPALFSPAAGNAGRWALKEMICMKALKRLFGAPSEDRSVDTTTGRITLSNPLVIRDPHIGFLNFMESSTERILEEDKAVLSPLFSSAEQGDRNPPVCDVLLIYGHLDSNGHFTNHPIGLREIIRISTAPIVIVASENSTESYIAAGKPTGYGQANLVMTLDRKDRAFTSFFSQLFERMFNGKSMLVAWVELAPQIPGASHEDCPDTIFAAEISHIVFKRAQQSVHRTSGGLRF